MFTGLIDTGPGSLGNRNSHFQAVTALRNQNRSSERQKKSVETRPVLVAAERNIKNVVENNLARKSLLAIVELGGYPDLTPIYQEIGFSQRGTLRATVTWRV